MAGFFRNIYYFFPVQLFLVHFKRNQVLLIFWLLLFGFVTKLIFWKIGAATIFLVPEYIDSVNFWSYLIFGISFGSFIMAFNVSGYIVNGLYFPFIATLARPFFKYTINNFIIPFFFTGIYIYYSLDFQINYEYLTEKQAIVNIAGFLAGTFFFIFLALVYFFTTNKDVFKMFGIRREKPENRRIGKPVRLILQKDLEWKKINAPIENMGAWRIETYMAGLFKIRRARNTGHYTYEMIRKVLRQNHKSATFYAFGIIIAILLFGIFMDLKYFMIPAGASLMLLFTLLTMIYSAIRSIFKEWALVVIIILITGSNLITQSFFFDFRNSGYGMTYKTDRTDDRIFNKEYYNSLDFQGDYLKTINILNNWKARNIDPEHPEKLPWIVFINTSGGGMKSMIWTYYSLSYTDSVLNGQLLSGSFMITGASGGMIGASFLRELYYRKQQGQMKSYYSDSLLNGLSRDMLNPVAFSFSLNDWFFKIKRFRYNGLSYYKDRAYSFENKLNENTGYILDKPITAYRDAEFNAEIPMIVLTPTVINDGRVMYISPQDISYYLINEFNRKKEFHANVEFRRLYRDFNADSLRLLSALRMNATFPYVTPIVAMPGVPQLQIMDAGIRDNYGLSTSLLFLNIFRDWIRENTSGVILLQVTEVTEKTEDENKSILYQFFWPMGNVYQNIFNTQEIHNEQLIEFSDKWISDNIKFINLSLDSRNDHISLSWHLTKKEKEQILKSIVSPDNRNSIEELKSLLDK